MKIALIIDSYPQSEEQQIRLLDNLKKLKKPTNQPPEDRYSRPCGGKGGFDDYVERWH